MYDSPISQLHSSLLLASLSLIPNHVLRLVALAAFLTLALVHLICLQRPSSQLTRLEAMIEKTEKIVHHANMLCRIGFLQVVLAEENLILEAERQRKYAEDIDAAKIMLNHAQLMYSMTFPNYRLNGPDYRSLVPASLHQRVQSNHSSCQFFPSTLITFSLCPSIMSTSGYRTDSESGGPRRPPSRPGAVNWPIKYTPSRKRNPDDPRSFTTEPDVQSKTGMLRNGQFIQISAAEHWQLLFEGLGESNSMAQFSQYHRLYLTAINDPLPLSSLQSSTNRTRGKKNQLPDATDSDTRRPQRI
ncbi:hypothetical protein GGX14DRAFT_392755 [Mycena pura]|uniref:Uncharacterized protein n=1 Tax=Mycena pura TaxID=153505 RepID=A0AAD6YDT0_9AGAR|nr:hypothetical protein GGX14DRAFT_392755 [Mycena pura]